MKKNQQIFGVPDREDIYKKYIDKFYICRPIGTDDSYVGKIKEIDSKRGKITLNPYFGLRFIRKTRQRLYDLIKKDFDVFLDLTKVSFEPTTADGIYHSCYLNNKERAKIERKEISDKQKKNKK